MDNKIFGYIGIGLIIVGIIFAGLMIKNQSDLLGATVNYSNSLSQINLYNSLESLLGDIDRVRIPLSNVSSTSVTIDFPSVAAASSSATTTAFSGAALGDFVLVSGADADLDLYYTAKVSSAGNVQIIAVSASSSAINPGSQSFRLRLLPQATFARPGALVTSSSTSN